MKCLNPSVSRGSSEEHPVRIFGQEKFEVEEGRVQGVVEIFQNRRWGVICASEDPAVAETNARGICEELFIHEVIVNSRQIRVPQEMWVLPPPLSTSCLITILLPSSPGYMNLKVV